MTVWLKRLGLSVGSTVLCLVLIEIVLRFLGIVPPRWAHPWHLEREDKRVGLDVYPDNPRGTFDVDLHNSAERQRWRAKGVPDVDRAAQRTPFAVAFEYNEHLCRGGEVGPRDPDVQRIVMIGDSFTEGQGVRQQDTFSSILGHELEGPVEVINCGRRGHDFPEIHEFFDRQLALEPDVVVYAMILNDPVQSDAFHARQAYLDDWIMDRRRLFTGEHLRGPSFWDLRLYTLAHDAIEAIRVGQETMQWYRDMYDEPNQEGWDATQTHVLQMHEAMEARGGELLVALIPLLIGLDDEYPFADVSGTIAEAFEAREVSFHDTTPAFLGRSPSELWVHPADRHPNEMGHRIIADDLRPELQRIVSERRRRRR